MTKLLEQAFKEASKLPEEEQNALAEMLLNDLASEQRWADAFAKSQDKLSLLAKEAVEEFKRRDSSGPRDRPVL
ncbi:MAG: hypothetical protein WD065_09480 [Planctomycetaceae bacterium]